MEVYGNIRSHSSIIQLSADEYRHEVFMQTRDPNHLVYRAYTVAAAAYQ